LAGIPGIGGNAQFGGFFAALCSLATAPEAISRKFFSLQKKNRELEGMRKLKKELIGMLEEANEIPGKFEQALIRVEGVIRKDHELQAMEVLMIMCELLYERAGVIKASSKDSPPEDLLEAMHTIIWATPRLGLAEMKTIKAQLKLKFGAEFVSKASAGKKSSHVQDSVKHRLTLPTPDLEHKMAYLTSIVAEAKKSIDVAALCETSESLLGDTLMRPRGDAGSSGGDDAGGGGGGGGDADGGTAASASSASPPVPEASPVAEGGYVPPAYPESAPASYPPAAAPPTGYASASSGMPSVPGTASSAGVVPAYPGPPGGADMPSVPSAGGGMTAEALEARLAKLTGGGGGP
jgi:vacuolar protein sorting-associated protein IST1